MKTYAKRFSQGHWSFFVPGSEEKWYATLAHKPDGLWNKVAEEMLFIFAESGHPVFRGTSAQSRGPLKSKDGGKKQRYIKTAEPTMGELLLRIIVSVYQLTIHGAVADW